MENLEIRKVCGNWRIWIDDGWRGKFKSEEDAKNRIEKVIQAARLWKLPITLYLFDVVSTPRLI